MNRALAETVFPDDITQLSATESLPDPLVMFDGKRIESAAEWNSQRVPELKALFQHYMYGPIPPAPKDLAFEVHRTNDQFLHGAATLKEVDIRFGNPERTIHALIILPNKRSGPVPVFVGVNFCGNHTVVDEPQVRIPPGWNYPRCTASKESQGSEATRGSEKDGWAVDDVIARGYGLAVYHHADIEPDHPNASEGIRATGTGAIPANAGWGAIAAWAWGIHRVVDYLVTDKAIDSQHLAVVGHSRMGKTALLAAAFDSRLSLAIPCQAGCGGTAPSRGMVGESVQVINKNFPHWFNDRFKLFGGRPEFLPFDQHELICLVAPRPVLLANAEEDTWANPRGQFEVLRAAEPVYRLLGTNGLGIDAFPSTGELVGNRLSYFIRPGKHSMTRADWRVFLDFADREWKRPAR